MDMPNMGGVAFIRGLRRLRADLPVIVSTGQAQTVDLAKLGDIGVSMILKKPFKGEILLRTLDTMFKAGAKELAG
jgi:DNA-binding response OmpR family regulator